MVLILAPSDIFAKTHINFNFMTHKRLKTCMNRPLGSTKVSILDPHVKTNQTLCHFNYTKSSCFEITSYAK